MYTFFTDKIEDFKCNIEVEGAKLSNTQARLALKTGDITLLYEGTVSSDGTCTIPVKNIKSLFENGDKGEVVLEVIADGTFFSPWSDTFEVKTKKKVTVEVAGYSEINEADSSTVKVSVVQPTRLEPVPAKTKAKTPAPVKQVSTNTAKTIASILMESDITKKNLHNNSHVLAKVIADLKENGLVKQNTNQAKLITEIIKYLD